MAFVRSKLHYAAPSWQPWISPTNVGVLDCVQNRVLRLITGQMAGSPTDALRLEAGVWSYQTHVNRVCLRSAEKALHIPTDQGDQGTQLSLPRSHPGQERQAELEDPGGSLPGPIAKRAQTAPRANFILWKSSLGGPASHHCLPRGPRRLWQKRRPERKQALTVKQINSFCADLVIYTDGSASAGTREGRAVVGITRGL